VQKIIHSERLKSDLLHLGTLSLGLFTVSNQSALFVAEKASLASRVAFVAVFRDPALAAQFS